MRKPQVRTLAFTLVELLVVIGILAVLIALVLWVTGNVRRQARVVDCSSKLRMIGQASASHAAQHEGRLPLAGRIVAAPGTDPARYPAGLNDRAQTRYRYAHAPDSPIKLNPLPFVAALAPHMGVTNLPTTDWDAMDQALNAKEGVWMHFICPDTDSIDKAMLNSDPNDATVVGQATMMICQIGPDVLSAWATNSDYVVNEGLFGFHYDGRYSRNRLAGHLAALSRPQEVVMFTDGVVRQTAADPLLPLGWMTWTPSLDGKGPATLADALAGSPRASSPENFDAQRHGGKMNAVFADGHVETLPITAGSLQGVYLVAP